MGGTAPTLRMVVARSIRPRSLGLARLREAPAQAPAAWRGLWLSTFLLKEKIK